ncbi:hypothetical protein J6590_070764 [Homalodisca vitripennis]|nr:hypothetical protein J6590_070764 [Homalodisca vitripennis]
MWSHHNTSGLTLWRRNCVVTTRIQMNGKGRSIVKFEFSSSSPATQLQGLKTHTVMDHSWNQQSNIYEAIKKIRCKRC